MEFTGERVVPNKTPARIYADHEERYKFATIFVKDLDVLDAACGTGYGSLLLKNAGATTVTGIDISQDAVNFAIEHYSNCGIFFDCCNLMEKDLGKNCYDTIVSFETIEHVPNPEQLVSSFYNALKTGGKLIVSSPNRIITSPGYIPHKKGKPNNEFHTIEYSLIEFKNLLSAHFTNVDIYGQRNRITIGRLNFARIFPKIDSDAFGAEISRIPLLHQPRYIVAVCKK